MTPLVGSSVGAVPNASASTAWVSPSRGAASCAAASQPSAAAVASTTTKTANARSRADCAPASASGGRALHHHAPAQERHDREAGQALAAGGVVAERAGLLAGGERGHGRLVRHVAHRGRHGLAGGRDQPAASIHHPDLAAGLGGGPLRDVRQPGRFEDHGRHAGEPAARVADRQAERHDRLAEDRRDDDPDLGRAGLADLVEQRRAHGRGRLDRHGRRRARSAGRRRRTARRSARPGRSRRRRAGSRAGSPGRHRAGRAARPAPPRRLGGGRRSPRCRAPASRR